jgi:hypothetical protein
MHQQIECSDVRDNQRGQVEYRDPVRCTQLAGQRGKLELNAMVIVDNDVGRPCDIEGEDERSE